MYKCILGSSLVCCMSIYKYLMLNNLIIYVYFNCIHLQVNVLVIIWSSCWIICMSKSLQPLYIYQECTLMLSYQYSPSFNLLQHVQQLCYSMEIIHRGSLQLIHLLGHHKHISAGSISWESICLMLRQLKHRAGYYKHRYYSYHTSNSNAIQWK